VESAKEIQIPDAFFDRVASKLRMLGDPTRLAILRTIMTSEKSVGAIVAETSGNQANVSKHLKMLMNAGLVRRRKAGLQVFYVVSDPLIEQLCRLVCNTIIEEVQSEVDRSRRLLEGLREGS
jgi:ArsR family transcriptional regulator